jgi:hypothetical protein
MSICVLSSHVRNLRVMTSSTPTSFIQKSIAASSFSFDLLLPDDRHDDASGRFVAASEVECGSTLLTALFHQRSGSRGGPPRCGGRTTA